MLTNLVPRSHSVTGNISSDRVRSGYEITCSLISTASSLLIRIVTGETGDHFEDAIFNEFCNNGSKLE